MQTPSVLQSFLLVEKTEAIDNTFLYFPRNSVQFPQANQLAYWIIFLLKQAVFLKKRVCI